MAHVFCAWLADPLAKMSWGKDVEEQSGSLHGGCDMEEENSAREERLKDHP